MPVTSPWRPVCQRTLRTMRCDLTFFFIKNASIVSFPSASSKMTSASETRRCAITGVCFSSSGFVISLLCHKNFSTIAQGQQGIVKIWCVTDYRKIPVVYIFRDSLIFSLKHSHLTLSSSTHTQINLPQFPCPALSTSLIT